jgi:predicted HTH transcriptional regulator
MLMIKQNNEITAPELALNIDVTEHSIERNIVKLKPKGFLRRMGPAKDGYREVNTVA